MIIIEKPFIQTFDNQVFIKAHVIDEHARIEDDCYYMTDLKHGKYFHSEGADSFILGLILPALQSSQDIIVKASMSEKLYYNLCNTVIYALSKAFGYKEIKVIPEKLINSITKSFAIGTGCSLGIDSFSTILQHVADEIPQSFKLTHLTYFNVGAHGDKDLKKVRNSYQKDFELVKEFSNEINIPLIPLESNLSIFYAYYNFDFNQCGLIRNISAVLSMQKLFKKYIYSSGYPISEICLSGIDLAKMEGMLLPALSTENTELIVGGPNLSRSEKAIQLSDNPIVQKHLYVCVKPLVVNNQMKYGPWVKIKDNNKKNCSGCDKCLRTLLIFDIVDRIDDYADLFDLNKYHSLKKLFMAKVIGLRNSSFVFKDVYNIAKKNGYKISIISRVLSLFYSLKINELFYWMLGKLNK